MKTLTVTFLLLSLTLSLHGCSWRVSSQGQVDKQEVKVIQQTEGEK
jgi:outer membrane lipopolysaccharide assembly protein LptE/RlpB